MPALQRKIKTATEAAGSDIVKNATASRWPPAAAVVQTIDLIDDVLDGRDGLLEYVRKVGFSKTVHACHTPPST